MRDSKGEYFSKKNFWTLSFLCLFAIPIQSFAHEGHDHDAPAVVTPRKGGIIKSVGKMNIEMVSKGDNLRLYFFDGSLNPMPVAGFQLDAKAEMPRSKKTEKVNFIAKENFFEADYAAKGIHRYSLLLGIRDVKAGKQDRLEFTIEPRN